jgi:rhamnogalacturonyl hydrolase YesR
MNKTTFFVAITILLFSCTNKNEDHEDHEENSVADHIDFITGQYSLMINQLEDSTANMFPRTIEEEKLKLVSATDWTSGFFSGSLWYIHELTGEEKWREEATKYTEYLDSIQYYTRNHDIGFMIYCSYGNGLRLTGNPLYKDIIINAAKSLSSRYQPNTGVIRSWSWSPKSLNWECPVIIDNMMNLELLFAATRLSGDSTFYHIAVSHADKTIENHFREDYSTWHVVDYSIDNGSIRNKNTYQGYSDDSSWARGQAWAVYGYVMCYRETKDVKYLEQAENVLAFIATHPNYPEDGVPYWDFDAPDIPNSYRDVSAATILASALYEISMYSDKLDYREWADKILTSLSSDSYLAELASNANFLLKHSVGSMPHNSEVDVPLNYADYYYLEALTRKIAFDK